jgi:hypothetical protein
MWNMDGTDSISSPLSGFPVSYAESSSSATRVGQTVDTVELEVGLSNEVSSVIVFVCLGNMFFIIV